MISRSSAVPAGLGTDGPRREALVLPILRSFHLMKGSGSTESRARFTQGPRRSVRMEGKRSSS
jgi:hypothetical protein